MLFFIDIGNTRIKYCTSPTTPIAYIDYQGITQLFDALKQQQATRLLITAGRSKHAQDTLSVIKTFAEKQAIGVEIVKVRPEILTINYTDSRQFGEDRFLNLLAARQDFTQNFCVISCGTAITLDFYTDRHIGGMITLGLGSAKQLLAEKTGLNKIQKPTSILGNDTATSIGSGLYFGYKNLIYGSVYEIENKKNLTFSLVFTGGDAGLLCNDNKNDIIINELLFKGMKIYDNYRT